MIFLLIILILSIESICLKTSINRVRYAHLHETTLHTLDAKSVMVRENLKPFLDVLHSQGMAHDECFRLIETLSNQGFGCVNDIVLFAKDFESRPELLSKILQQDFEIKPLDSHKLRAAMLQTLSANQGQTNSEIKLSQTKNSCNIDNNTMLSPSPSKNSPQNSNELTFKQFKVLPLQRKYQNDDYGAKETDMSIELNQELNQFLAFMTLSSPRNQESPIRLPTGKLLCE